MGDNHQLIFDHNITMEQMVFPANNPIDKKKLKSYQKVKMPEPQN
jgi:hypothetical protein